MTRQEAREMFHRQLNSCPDPQQTYETLSALAVLLSNKTQQERENLIDKLKEATHND